MTTAMQYLPEIFSKILLVVNHVPGNHYGYRVRYVLDHFSNLASTMIRIPSVAPGTITAMWVIRLEEMKLAPIAIRVNTATMMMCITCLRVSLWLVAFAVCFGEYDISLIPSLYLVA